MSHDFALSGFVSAGVAEFGAEACTDVGVIWSDIVCILNIYSVLHTPPSILSSVDLRDSASKLRVLFPD